MKQYTVTGMSCAACSSRVAKRNWTKRMIKKGEEE